MKIAITGAGGMIGAAFARHYSSRHQVVALRHCDLDITNRRAVGEVMQRERPALVINCAVVGVDAGEGSPMLAQAVNVDGAAAVAAAAAATGAELMHLSTNYVFDGERDRDSFYTINDRPAPINVYGRTKLAGERAVVAAAPRSYIVRTSWVFGFGKENFFSTAHLYLRDARRLKAIADIWGSTTYVADLVSRVDEILAQRHYATYHIVNNGMCSYYEFAVEAARILGMTGTEIEHLIERSYAAQNERLAVRPRSTPLRCLIAEELGMAPMRDWREALADYLQIACRRR